MAKRGRKPTPIVLSGDHGGPPIKPTTVRRDRYASQAWDYVAKALDDARVLSRVDVFALTALCSAYSRLVKARQIIAKDGLTITNMMNGSTKAHPLLGVESGAAGEMHRYASELGFSPTSRARIQLLEEQAREATIDDELDE